MDRFSNDREALDFIASRLADEATRDGVEFSEVERKMLYFSETAWTLPDIMDVNDQFDANCNQDTYEKKISQLIKRSVSRARKQQPEELKTWTEAIRRLSKEDRYLLVMVEQAGLGATFRPPRRPRPPGDLWKLWGTGITVAALLGGLFGSLVWVINKRFPETNPPPNLPRNGALGFAIWVAMVCIAIAYSLLRLLVGARKFDDMTGRALEWIFGLPKRGR